MRHQSERWPALEDRRTSQPSSATPHKWRYGESVVDWGGKVAAWFAGLTAAAAALAALVASSVQKPLHNWLFVILVVIAGISFVALLVTGPAALWRSWHGHRKRQRRHAEAVTIKKDKMEAQLRNGGSDRITDVVIEATIDLERVTKPWGWTREEINAEESVRIPVEGDVQPIGPKESPRKIPIGVKWSAQPEPYLPKGLTEQRIKELLLHLQHPGTSLPAHYLHEYLDNQDVPIEKRLRCGYEALASGGNRDEQVTKSLPDAITDLFVVFTDIEDQRWRRGEDGSLHLLSPRESSLEGSTPV